MKLMTLGELFATEERDDFLIKPVFGGEPGEYMLIVGPAGVGKSYLVIDLACRIALGMDWYGHAIDIPKTVSYVALEGTINAFKKRFKIFNKTYPGIEDVVRFGFIEERVKLKNNSDLIAKWAQGCDVLVIDPLKYAVSGDYCKPEYALEFVASLQEASRRYGIPVILTHHVKKKNPQSHFDPDDLDQIKGATEYADHASTVLIFEKSRQLRNDSGKFAGCNNNYRTVHFSKTRDAGGKLDDLYLEWHPKTYDFEVRDI